MHGPAQGRTPLWLFTAGNAAGKYQLGPAGRSAVSQARRGRRQAAMDYSHPGLTGGAVPVMLPIPGGQVQQQVPTAMPAAGGGGLPQGWEQRVTPEGKNYYVDHQTGTTHWQLPAGPQQPQQPVMQPAPVPQPTVIQQPTAFQPAAAPALPAGWEQVVAPDGKTYFLDHNTGLSQWQPPPMLAPAPAPAPAPMPLPAAAPPLLQLPPGWEQKVSPDGKTYFLDHNTGSTQWQPPAAQAPAPLPMAPTVQSPMMMPTVPSPHGSGAAPSNQFSHCGCVSHHRHPRTHTHTHTHIILLCLVSCSARTSRSL